jgi:hypothetical protein
MEALALGLNAEGDDDARNLVREGVEAILCKPNRSRLRPLAFGGDCWSRWWESEVCAAKATAATSSGAACTMASIDAGTISMAAKTKQLGLEEFAGCERAVV